jgi:hypothetical protein
MREHLVPNNLYRLRCELELELRRSICGAEFSSLEHAHQLTNRVIEAHEPNDVEALSAACFCAYAEAIHAQPGAIKQLSAAINHMSNQLGERHPETLRYRWLLCRLLYDKGEETWHQSLAAIAWLGHAPGARNRIEDWVLHQLSSRGLELPSRDEVARESP